MARRLWKPITAVVAIGIAVVVLASRNRLVSGQPSNTATASPVDDPHEPFTPYALGPGAIPYEKEAAADRVAIDHMAEVVDTSQSAGSIDAFARASKQAADMAQAEIAARQVGLIGTEEQGVNP